MIIDIHAHTSNRPLYGLHTTDASIEEIERWRQKFGIDYIVLLATYFPFKGTGLHNEQLLSRIVDHPHLLMFGSLDAMNNFVMGLQHLRQLAERGLIRGIKLYPGYQDFNPSSTHIFPVYQLAEEFSLPVMFHTGELHHCCPEEKRLLRCGGNCPIEHLGHLALPRSIRGAVANFPRVNFILSHMSNPEFDELRQLMREFSNVYTDISGQYLSGTEEDTEDYKGFIVSEIQKFFDLPNGRERVMLGTDFPIQSYADSFELIVRLRLDSVSRDLILGQTAARLLKLRGTT